MSRSKSTNTRQRTNTDMKEDDAVNIGLSLNSDARNPNAGTRPPRVPLRGGQNLVFADVELDKDNYRYYAFYDDPAKPGRIEAAKAAYWEEVTTRDGRAATRPAGAGRHILMRLPIQYALEDLEMKRKKVQTVMADYGDIKQAEKGSLQEYAPDSVTGKAEGGESMFVRQTESESPYAE